MGKGFLMVLKNERSRDSKLEALEHKDHSVKRPWDILSLGERV